MIIKLNKTEHTLTIVIYMFVIDQIMLIYKKVYGFIFQINVVLSIKN